MRIAIRLCVMMYMTALDLACVAAPAKAVEVTVPNLSRVPQAIAKPLRNTFGHLSLDDLNRYGLRRAANRNNGSIDNPIGTVNGEGKPFIHIDYVQPIPGNREQATGPGLREVIGYRFVPAQPSVSGTPTVKRILWRWEPPKEWRDAWLCQTNSEDTDTHRAFSLAPLQWDGPNPQLVMLSTMSGFQWISEIPVRETISQIGALGYNVIPSKKVSTPEGSYVPVAISADGSRVMAIVIRSDIQFTLIFIYDRSGSLLRSIAVRGFRYPIGYSFGPDRGLSGTGFVIPLSLYEIKPNIANPVASATSGVYLLDSDGNFVCRFVDDNGKPFRNIVSVSHDNKSAYGSARDASLPSGTRDYLFTIPSLTAE